MGNTTSHRFFNNIDVLSIIFEKLDLTDQITLSKLDKELHDILHEKLGSRMIKMTTSDLALDGGDDDDDHSKDIQEYLLKYGENFQRLSVTGHGDFFAWYPLRMLLNLTEIFISEVTMHAEDINWMIILLKNVQYIKLQCVQYERMRVHYSFNYNFESKSLRKLNATYNSALCCLIGNSMKLEELVLEGTPKWYCGCQRNPKLFPFDAVDLQSDALQKIFSADDEITELTFDITLKRDELSTVNLHSLKLTNQSILPDNLVYLKTIKKLTLRNLLPAENLIENSLQIKYLHLHSMRPELEICRFRFLKVLELSYGEITSSKLNSILMYLNLNTLKLIDMAHRAEETSESSNELLSSYNSALRQLSFTYKSEVFENFFTRNTCTFTNLKQLCFIKIESAQKLMEILTNEPNWKLKNLVFHDCTLGHVTTTTRNSLRLRHLTLLNCTNCHSSYLQYIFGLNHLRNLTICKTAVNCEGLNLAASSLRFIEADDFEAALWISFLEQSLHSIQFTIFNPKKSMLDEFYSNSLIKGKIKSIEYKKDRFAKVNIDDNVINSLPISISHFDQHEFLLNNYSYAKDTCVHSAVIIHLN